MCLDLPSDVQKDPTDVWSSFNSLLNITLKHSLIYIIILIALDTKIS